ncbi:hypothetical protein D3C83_105880 [compost metagenome]
MENSKWKNHIFAYSLFPITYLRITFSDAVSASMNAGRLNRRSAYFMSGAAVLGSETP